MSGREDYEERKERKRERYEEKIENLDNKKAEYYKEKLKILENSKVISADDPKAKEKLQEKIDQLERLRIDIKLTEHSTYTLQRISAEIRRLKKRQEEIEQIEELNFTEITFENGKIIHNEEINRIQIIFDNVPNEQTRTILKSYGFKWAKSQGAWQRLYNKNCIRAVKCIMNELERKENYVYRRSE